MTDLGVMTSTPVPQRNEVHGDYSDLGSAPILKKHTAFNEGETLQVGRLPDDSYVWKNAYREILGLPAMSPSDKLRRAVRLRELYVKFDDNACEIAKTLVSEVNVDPRQKKIPPVNMGGIAGGEKYMHDGIYFKFARDWREVYGGDEYAMKCADHELLSLKTIMSLGLSNISTPLMSLIDYHGFRMIAQCLIPIDHNSTLVYGSADGGRTVQRRSPDFNAIMENAAGLLNLKEHYVGGSGVTLHMPGDLEGHIGFDGTYYVVDAARLFPPEAPLRSTLFIPADEARAAKEVKFSAAVLSDPDRWAIELSKLLNTPQERVKKRETRAGLIWYEESPEENCRASLVMERPIHGNAVLMRCNKVSSLYTLLRPELVRHYRVPLSSDAWTLFSAQDPNRELHNREVSEATHLLVTEVINDFAQKLNRHKITPTTHQELVDALHARGINIRYLGRLRRQVSVPHLRSFLLTEMCCRVCKNAIRKMLRRLAGSTQAEQKREMVDYFNCLLGSSQQSAVFWHYELKTRIQYKFMEALTEKEANPAYDMRDDLILFTLLQRLMECTGVYFSRGARRRLFEHPFLFDRKNPLAAADFDGIYPRIKNANISGDVGELIDEAVRKEEEEALELVSKMDDKQLVASFKLLVQLKKQRWIEQLLGADSKEAVQSYFQLSHSHLSAGNYQMALDTGIRGHAYGEVLFGAFSDAAVRGLVIIGKAYEKLHNFTSAIHYFNRALDSVSRLQKQHPLVGQLNMKLYVCVSMLLQSDPDSAKNYNDPQFYLWRAFEAYSQMFGESAARLLPPIVGLEDNVNDFVSQIELFLAQDHFSQETFSGKPFLETLDSLWPPLILSQVKEEQERRSLMGYSPDQRVTKLAGVAAAFGLHSIAGISEESLGQRGVKDPAIRLRILDAVHTLCSPELMSSNSTSSPGSSGSSGGDSTLAAAFRTSSFSLSHSLNMPGLRMPGSAGASDSAKGGPAVRMKERDSAAPSPSAGSNVGPAGRPLLSEVSKILQTSVASAIYNRPDLYQYGGGGRDDDDEV